MAAPDSVPGRREEMLVNLARPCPDGAAMMLFSHVMSDRPGAFASRRLYARFAGLVFVPILLLDFRKEAGR